MAKGKLHLGQNIVQQGPRPGTPEGSSHAPSNQRERILARNAARAELRRRLQAEGEEVEAAPLRNVLPPPPPVVPLQVVLKPKWWMFFVGCGVGSVLIWAVERYEEVLKWLHP